MSQKGRHASNLKHEGPDMGVCRVCRKGAKPYDNNYRDKSPVKICCHCIEKAIARMSIIANCGGFPVASVESPNHEQRIQGLAAHAEQIKKIEAAEKAVEAIERARIQEEIKREKAAERKKKVERRKSIRLATKYRKEHPGTTWEHICKMIESALAPDELKEAVLSRKAGPQRLMTPEILYAVREYQSQHIGWSWKEIFAAVENPYKTCEIFYKAVRREEAEAA